MSIGNNFIPKAIQAKPGLENFSKYFLVFLLVENQIRSTYVETLIKGGNLLENLPLHLCDFSARIAVFLLTGFSHYLFLHISGNAGAGMSILTPDSEFAFLTMNTLQLCMDIH